MKKAVTIFALIITFFVIYFLQANFFTWFTINGIMPNLFVIFVLFIGLFAGKKIGFTLGILFGIYIDFLTGKSIGISAILLGLLGLASEKLDKNFSKDSRITIITIMALGTVIFELGCYILKIIKYNSTIEFLSFTKILLIEVLFNIFITIIIYPLIQKAGNKIEDVFKSKNILTRYF